MLVCEIFYKTQALKANKILLNQIWQLEPKNLKEKENTIKIMGKY